MAHPTWDWLTLLLISKVLQHSVCFCLTTPVAYRFRLAMATASFSVGKRCSFSIFSKNPLACSAARSGPAKTVSSICQKISREGKRALRDMTHWGDRSPFAPATYRIPPLSFQSLATWTALNQWRPRRNVGVQSLCRNRLRRGNELSRLRCSEGCGTKTILNRRCIVPTMTSLREATWLSQNQQFPNFETIMSHYSVSQL